MPLSLALPALAAATASGTTHSMAADAASAASQIDTLWVLVATVLALLMAPGVALFYGGLVHAKSVINMMMMTFGAMALVGVIWVTYGYGMVFGPALLPHWLGSPFGAIGLNAISNTTQPMSMHDLATALFHAAFAIDVVALISGAIAGRARFGPWMVFAGLWVSVVYFPVARWIFNPNGWAARLGVNDFAGGIAVHVSAGAAALAVAIVLGRRHGFSKAIDAPHNVPMTLLGAGLLWIGWFGFNAGSEGTVNATTLLACVNTLVAPGAAILGWLGMEKLRDGKPTSVGAASGLVAGLVASAASCNVLAPGWSMVMGAAVGAICALVADLRFRFGVDDSLNVVGIHLVGGLLGALFVGIAGRGMGVVYTGSWGQFAIQAVVAVTVAGYSFAAAWAIAHGIHRVVGFRAPEHAERSGIDEALHGERGYAMHGA